MLSSETLHASTVSIKGRAVLIEGPSGSGKSDLALRLIDRGATLVSDDYTIVRRIDGNLIASAPPNIAGLCEVRGCGADVDADRERCARRADRQHGKRSGALAPAWRDADRCRCSDPDSVYLTP